MEEEEELQMIKAFYSSPHQIAQGNTDQSKVYIYIHALAVA